MIALMFVMTWMSGYVSGPIVTVTEFTSAERCDAAVRNLYQEARSWSVTDNRIRAFCVLK